MVLHQHLPTYPEYRRYVEDDHPSRSTFPQGTPSGVGSPGGTSGGTVAVCDLATGSVSLQEIRIPVSLDNSYHAELFVAWVVLRSNATVCPAAGSTGRSSGLNAFSDSQSYISALTKRIVDDRDAVGLPEALIRGCRRMGRGSPTIGPRAEEGPKDSRVLE